MKSSSHVISLAVLGATLVATTATAVPPARGSAASATEIDQFFSRLAGEWEGQVQASQPSGNVSGSIASLCARVSDDRRSLTSCFDGFSFGQPFEGAAAISLDAKSNQFQQVWFDSFSNSTVTGVAQHISKDSIIFNGRATDKSGLATKFEQVLTFVNDGDFRCEYFTVASDGHKTSVMKLDLTRMANGSRSSAADQFNNAPLMARVRSTDQQASADTAK